MSGKKCKDFGLPMPIYDNQNVVINRDIVQELAYDTVELSTFVSTNVPLLNSGQLEAFNRITSSKGGLFFLDAPGGTGKTFLIKLLLANVRKDQKIALAVASSGIASTLLPGGRTAHSVFKLPLNLNVDDKPSCNLSKQSNMASVLRQTDLFVFDEVTMMNKKALEAIDRCLRDFCNEPNKIMGGKTFVLSGDFRQTLPIITRGTRANEVNACLKYSYLWPHVEKLKLTENMRVMVQGKCPYCPTSHTKFQISYLSRKKLLFQIQFILGSLRF